MGSRHRVTSSLRDSSLFGYTEMRALTASLPSFFEGISIYKGATRGLLQANSAAPP